MLKKSGALWSKLLFYRQTHQGQGLNDTQRCAFCVKTGLNF